MCTETEIRNRRTGYCQEFRLTICLIILLAGMSSGGCPQSTTNSPETIEGQQFRVASTSRVPAQFINKLPVLTPERRAEFERERHDEALGRTRQSGAQLAPEPPPAGSEIDLHHTALKEIGRHPVNRSGAGSPDVTFAPGQMVSFLGSSVLPAPNDVSAVAEPSLAQSGKFVFITGNWFVARSVDGGLTWSYIDPTADMKDFCCDQDVVYDRGRDLYLWYREGVSDQTTGTNRVLLGASTDGGNSWCQYQITPAILNPAWTSQHMLDYPVLSLSTNYLYILTGLRGAADTVMMRLPLDPLETCSSLSASWWGALSTWAAPVQNATTTMYFGDHRGTSNSMRIYTLPEAGSALSYKDVKIPSWKLEQGSACPLDSAQNCCPSPDGSNWCSRSDSEIRAGWVANGVIGFMWNAKQGGPFPFPYVEAATFDETSFHHLTRPLVWSSQGAFHYPFVSPDIRGNLGMTAYFASSTTPPSPDFLVMDDYSPGAWQAFRLFTGTRGAPGWGDYSRTRVFHPAEVGWTASVYTVQAKGAEPLFYILARARDLPSIQAWWSK